MGNRTSAALGVLLAVAMLPGCGRPAPDHAAPAEAATPA